MKLDMEKKFSKEDVLRYLYGEMAGDEEQYFLDALVKDEALWMDFEQLKETKDQLSAAELQPSESSISKIKAFAKTQIQRTTRRNKRQGKVKFLSLNLVMALVMVLFIASVSLYGIYRYQQVSDEPVVERNQSRLMWDDPSLDNKIKEIQYDIRNLSAQREVPVHMIHNTYRLVNLNPASPCGENVVLLNLK